ncbi:bifunctional precorrin-2 dehydrogenase/sirohydrochlorin ferrochelatase [uncultured Cetobacterium sp.]|uniref:precorrin-2 dehydrogenase/sirohydrochlorin ferrochelatase family protein n=1 Tax=uncultured Cetobacterium sp. TaxID=527638 RepID=UPI002617C832|nr:bifunctional precorrin-2 dehydrogenase/sirohydrochlorin ferrochelatase [uncultured Cetobacterium sp.]
MDRKSYFPVFLDLNDKECLIVGAGNIALRKAKTLLEYGAKVKIISIDIKDEFYNLPVEIEKREFRKEDLQGIFLVVTGTDNETLNSGIVKICNEKNILVNNITSKIDMSVRFGAVICDDEYTIGISANGNPKKAIKIKEKIKDTLKNG